MKHDPDEATAFQQEQRADQDFRPQHEPAGYTAETVEGHLRNCRQILWSLREKLEVPIPRQEASPNEQVVYLVARDMLADVNAADSRLAAALAEYAREHTAGGGD